MTGRQVTTGGSAGAMDELLFATTEPAQPTKNGQLSVMDKLLGGAKDVANKPETVQLGTVILANDTMPPVDYNALEAVYEQDRVIEEKKLLMQEGVPAEEVEKLSRIVTVKTSGLSLVEWVKETPAAKDTDTLTSYEGTGYAFLRGDNEKIAGMIKGGAER
jgi:hypothetical protein